MLLERLATEGAADADHYKPGATLRLALADALEEDGKPEEASHMRSKYPLSIHDGKPQLSTLRLHRMLSAMGRYTRNGDEHHRAGPPSALRLEAAAELEKLGRTHEAALLRSQHPINTNSWASQRSLREGDNHQIQHQMSVTGDYPRYFHGGGEALYQLRDGGGFFCSRCANGENGSEVLNPEVADDSQWQVDHRHPYQHEEGPPEGCEHCGRQIEALYGDPNEPDEDR